MNLERARLCLDCGEVFDTMEGRRHRNECPECGRRRSALIAPWLDRQDDCYVYILLYFLLMEREARMAAERYEGLIDVCI